MVYEPMSDPPDNNSEEEEVEEEVLVSDGEAPASDALAKLTSEAKRREEKEIDYGLSALFPRLGELEDVERLIEEEKDKTYSLIEK